MGTRNTVKITQPYQGDRGVLRVYVEAENLPAGAYGELEPVFDAAEKWASKWLSSTTGDGGKELLWWETPLRDLPIETRYRNPLVRRFGGDTQLSGLLDEYSDADGDISRLTRIPGFGETSLSALEGWISRVTDDQGPYLSQAVADAVTKDLEGDEDDE